MLKKKILIYAYMISPTRGSEWSLAWNYVTEMSQHNDLVVLYGMSGDHMGDIAEVESYLKENPMSNVRFIAVKPNKLANILNTLNRKGVFVYTFYFAYQVWQKQVYRVAKDLASKEKFDLIHHVGPIGYRTPGYLWKLNLPYMWGPISGTHNVPFKLMGALPLSGKIKLGFRTIANLFQLHFKILVKRAIKRTDVLLTATSSVQKDIARVFKVDSVYLPENAIMKIQHRNENKFDEIKLKLIWIGRIDANKALIILLRSLAKISDIYNIELHIVGDGPMRNELWDFAVKNNLERRIIWHGTLPRAQVFNLLNNAHLHIITSLSEANTTVILEAMSFGVPTMSLDHCGMSDTICKKCGIKIAIIALEQVIYDIAVNIQRLAIYRDELKRLSDGVLICAKNYTWDKHKKVFEKMYDQTILNWQQNNYK